MTVQCNMNRAHGSVTDQLGHSELAVLDSIKMDSSHNYWITRACSPMTCHKSDSCMSHVPYQRVTNQIIVGLSLINVDNLLAHMGPSLTQ